jgi:prephenate dehydrogenase
VRGAAGAALGNIAVVGAGQIGTMIGMALRADGRDDVREVAVYDRDLAVANASFERGSADRVLATEDEVFQADTIVLCVPVPEIVRLVVLWGPALPPGTFLVDAGSAKKRVVEAMRRLPKHVHALGGHPMAGTHIRGPAGARPELLQNAAFIFTPVRDDVAALERGRALARAVRARAVELDAPTHDAVAAVTSHLPHVAAFALMSLASSREHARELVGSGFADATRLADSDPEMVAGFLSANALQVHRALGEFVAILERLASRLDDDPQALAHLLSDLVVERERVA